MNQSSCRLKLKTNFLRCMTLPSFIRFFTSAPDMVGARRIRQFCQLLSIFKTWAKIKLLVLGRKIFCPNDYHSMQSRKYHENNLLRVEIIPILPYANCSNAAMHPGRYTMSRSPMTVNAFRRLTPLRGKSVKSLFLTTSFRMKYSHIMR